MNSRKLSAGDIIDARCTKCRAVTNHRIVAMVGDRVVRVECNTCHGVHNYHPPEENKMPATGKSRRNVEISPRKTRKEPEAADREEWESLLSTMQREKAIAYDMNGKYRLNDLVEHTVFGVGIVKLLIRPNKMQVLFQGGKKLLRCSE